MSLKLAIFLPTSCLLPICFLSTSCPHSTHFLSSFLSVPCPLHVYFLPSSCPLLVCFLLADPTCPLPQFANPDFTQPISEVVDEVIQNCPIDVRRPLYKVQCPYPPTSMSRLMDSCFTDYSLPLAEHCALWRLHHVQGLWPAAAEGPEEDGGCPTQDE